MKRCIECAAIVTGEDMLAHDPDWTICPVHKQRHRQRWAADVMAVNSKRSQKGIMQRFLFHERMMGGIERRAVETELGTTYGDALREWPYATHEIARKALAPFHALRGLA